MTDSSIVLEWLADFKHFTANRGVYPRGIRVNSQRRVKGKVDFFESGDLLLYLVPPVFSGFYQTMKCMMSGNRHPSRSARIDFTPGVPEASPFS
jgi:hypothetical protein